MFTAICSESDASLLRYLTFSVLRFCLRLYAHTHFSGRCNISHLAVNSGPLVTPTSHGDTAGSAMQGLTSRYPFNNVGDRGLMFRDYLVLQVGLSLEVWCAISNFPCNDLCEIPWFQVPPIPFPFLSPFIHFCGHPSNIMTNLYMCRSISTPQGPDSWPLSILSSLSTMSFPSKKSL